MFENIRQDYFPHKIVDDFIIEATSDTSLFWADAAPLMSEIFPKFTDIGAYGYAVPTERKDKGKPLTQLFSRSHHERFLFKTQDGQAIGFSYGDMRDAQTFFMTSTGILPAYQRRGIYSAFLRQYLKYLHAIGYERVLSNHQPNNRAVIIAKLKLGFNITALNLDERWGAQVELTYFFHEDRREGYRNAFSLENRDMPNVI